MIGSQKPKFDRTLLMRYYVKRVFFPTLQKFQNTEFRKMNILKFVNLKVCLAAYQTEDSELNIFNI